MKHCYKLFDDWEVSFYHEFSDYESPRLGNYLTLCTLRKPKTSFVFAGCAVLHEGELGEDIKGFKVAFARAVDNAYPYYIAKTEWEKRRLQEERRKFWDALLPQLENIS